MTVKPEDIANVRGMTIESGKVKMDLEVAREVMLAMAASAVAILEDASAPNFVEMELKSANYDIPHTTLSIGYANRPTPFEIIARLRGELSIVYRTESLSDRSRWSIEKAFVELGYEDKL
jgi:hypothetical protein